MDFMLVHCGVHVNVLGHPLLCLECEPAVPLSECTQRHSIGSETALMSASLSGNITMIHHLLHLGANVNSQNQVKRCVFLGCSKSSRCCCHPLQYGRSPLHCACMAGSLDCVELLLDNGARVNCKTIDGVTPLHTASWLGLTAIIQRLMLHGADAQARDNVRLCVPCYLSSG